jgi:hypothetical protein
MASGATMSCDWEDLGFGVAKKRSLNFVGQTAPT